MNEINRDKLKEDIWCLGVLLYELCCLRYPFQGPSVIQTYQLISSNKSATPIPNIYSQELKVLLTKLLNKNPADRPTINEVMDTPIIKAAIEQIYFNENSPMDF